MPKPMLEKLTVPFTVWPAFTAEGNVPALMASGAAVTVVAALEVVVELELITVAGAVTDAVLTMLPVPAVPFNVSVTAPPAGKVGMAIPGPCRLAGVSPLLGQSAPPVAAVHVTAV